jgi:integrase
LHHHVLTHLLASLLTIFGNLDYSSCSKNGTKDTPLVPESEHFPAREDPMRTYVLTQTAFGEAAAMWLETRKPYISERTYADYKNYIITLSLFFGETKLPEVTADQIRAYQRMRMTRAGASIINHECSVLQQMLKRIGCWPDIGAQYQPLPLPRESPHRVLTADEEARLYRVGAQHPEWDVAYCAFVLGMNTTMHASEIRHIRLGDINVNHPEGPMLYVQRGKTRSRQRTIPLNSRALGAINYLVERAEKLGSIHADDYLIPFRLKRGFYDPRRPSKGWRTAMDKLLAKAEVKITPYSFRHHCITVLYENPDVSEETLESISGTIPATLKRHYSHIRNDAKRKALQSLEKIAPLRATGKLSSWKQA